MCKIHIQYRCFIVRFLLDDTAVCKDTRLSGHRGYQTLSKILLYLKHTLYTVKNAMVQEEPKTFQYTRTLSLIWIILCKICDSVHRLCKQREEALKHHHKVTKRSLLRFLFTVSLHDPAHKSGSKNK